MSAKNKICFAALAMAACVMPVMAQTVLLSQNFDKTSQPVKTIGRGDSRVTADGVFRSQDSYGLFGDKTMRNYRMRFKARAPKDAEQVQIWAGFNAANRYDRYVVGIKGGLQDDLYLARQGYMGTDEFLDIRELGFHPEPGQWIDVTIEQADGRIRVFLNNEDTPHIDLVDKNHDLAPAGYATLGGSWVPTEFDDLVIEQLPEGYFANIPAKTKNSISPTPKKRQNVRASAAHGAANASSDSTAPAQSSASTVTGYSRPPMRQTKPPKALRPRPATSHGT